MLLCHGVKMTIIYMTPTPLRNLIVSVSFFIDFVSFAYSWLWSIDLLKCAKSAFKNSKTVVENDCDQSDNLIIDWDISINV